jgi:ribonucleoside-diphosphate reductase alpha chain
MEYLGIDIDLNRDSLFDELGLKRLKQSYMKDDETSPQHRLAFVSKSFASNKEHAQRLYDYSSKHWLSYSTPILSFGRSKKGLPISCFLNFIDDSAEGLVDNLSETNWLSMVGGGVGIGFGIRSIDNKSAGVMPHLKIYDASCLAYKQGVTRRGSYAAYLDISHPDIIPFLEMRKPTGDPNLRCLNLHHGINITDSFMQIIENCMIDPNFDDSWDLIDPHSKEIKDTVSAKWLWQNIIEIRMHTGEPYLHFIDTSNKNLPKFLLDNGLTIKQSNLCVSGDQRVPSNFGILTAKELYDIGEELTLASNEGPVKSTKMELIEKDADTFTVTLDNGMNHTVTEYHKIVVKRSRFEVENISVSKLKIGDLVAIQTNEGVFGKTNMPKEAFLLGLYHGDGTQQGNCVHIDIWEHDFDLIEEIESDVDYIYNKYNLNEPKEGTDQRYNKTPKFNNCNVSQSTVKKKRLSSFRFLESLGFKKNFIPNWVWSGDKETQWSYLKGCLFTDGTVFVSKSKGNPIQLNISSINRNFLKELQIIFANLGIQTSIRLLRTKGKTLLPDGKGGKKEYDCKDCYRLIVGNKNDALTIERNTGFLTRRGVKIEDKEYRDNTKKFYKVTSIDYSGKQNVYCVGIYNESHLWVCNGFITHNCSEIILPTDKNRTAVCCLSSLNIEYYDEWKDNSLFIKDVAEMLDNVLQYFIDNAPDTIKRAKYSAMRERSIGIGALGFHSYLQSKSVPFESVAAKTININIFKNINKKVDVANIELGKERGPAPDAESTGQRFSLTMAIAPNASSSIILGNTSPSIECLRANAFRQDTLSGSSIYKNKYLAKIVNEYTKNEDERQTVWSSIICNDGSVQHLEWMSEKDKKIFKTSMEIDQRWVIDLASDRQKFIDQAQSVNLFFRPDSNIKYIHAVHFSAWKKGLKTLYYCRSEKLAKADKIANQIEREIIKEINIKDVANASECLACEG